MSSEGWEIALRRRAQARAARGAASPDPAAEELQLKQIELQLQQEELEQLRSALEAERWSRRALHEHAPVPYAILDASGVVSEANQALRELIGEQPEQLLGQPLARWVAPGHVASLERCLQQARSPRSRGAVEVALVSVGEPTQRPVRLELRRAPSTTAIHCGVFDLSELRSVQASAHADAVRAQLLLEGASEAFVVMDAAGQIEDINPAGVRLLGYTGEELRGQPLSALIPQLTPDALLGAGQAQDVVVLRSDGRHVVVELGVGTWREGDAVRLIAVLRDITSQRQVELERKLGAERLAQLAEHLDAVLYIRELDGTPSYVSDACAAVWGRTPEELCSEPSAWWDAVHPGDRDFVADAVGALSQRGSIDLRYRVRHPDGSVRWVRDRAFMVRDVADTPVRTIGVIHDVTADTQRLQQRLRSRKMEVLGDLAGGIAHDFANILMGIEGCARIGARASDDEASVLHFELIGTAAHRGVSLVRRLQQFVRGRTDEVPVQLDRAVEGAARLVEPLLGDHIRLEVGTRAPDGVVVASPSQIDQVVLNLATNARDAMPTGGTLRLSTEVCELQPASPGEAPRPGVRLDVTDDGAGMELAVLERILEPHFTTKDPSRGTGFGLTNVHQIVEELGGDLTVASTPGVGTTVTARLPVVELPEPRRSLPIEALPARTILLVEDDPLVRWSIRDQLVQLGQTVLEASTLEEALERCDEARIELLLVDVELPDITGTELAARIRAHDPRLPILFTSAHPHEQLLTRGTLGADQAFIQKPFQVERLREQLLPLVQQQQAVEQALPDAG